MADRKQINNQIIIMDKQRAMLLVLAAMIPSFMMGTYIFGVEVPILTIVCAGSAMFFEWAYEKLTKKPSTVDDFSAIVTGAILAFSLPSTFPLWMAVIGTFIAIVIVKQLGGELGRHVAGGRNNARNGAKNIINPAVTARIALQLLFTEQITTWPLNDFVRTADDSPEAATGSTPLDLLAEGRDLPGLPRLFMGFISGPCGQVCAAAILIGGAFLIWKKVISPVIPLSVIGAVFVFSFVYYSIQGDAGDGVYMALFHILAGGVLFGAVFCATDPVTSPKSTGARVVYGIGIGLITMLMRLWGPFPEGISAGIVLMNVAAPFLDRAAGSIKIKRES